MHPCGFNRPFPSWSKLLFQSEAKCKAIDMKMIIYSHANKTNFHMKWQVAYWNGKVTVLDIEIGIHCKESLFIVKIFNIHMYILYENGQRIVLMKTLIPKMHLNTALLDLCVSTKMGHCGCMKRSRVVSQTSTFFIYPIEWTYDSKLDG